MGGSNTNLWGHNPHAHDKWETPAGFFKYLNQSYRFDLDVCALPENAKCDRFFTPEDDGLTQPWEGSCWMNPPYGRDIKRWVRKAFETAHSGKGLVVGLLPASTDARWWHEYIEGAAVVQFISGRLSFGDAKNRAPFGNALVNWLPNPNHRKWMN